MIQRTNVYIIMYTAKCFFPWKKAFFDIGWIAYGASICFCLRCFSGRISVYDRSRTAPFKKFLQRKLEFCTDKTAVHSGQNCSSMPRKFFKTRDGLFESMARMVLTLHEVQMLHRDDYRINLLFFEKMKLLNKRKTDAMSYFVCLFAKKLRVVFSRPSADVFWFVKFDNKWLKTRILIPSRCFIHGWLPLPVSPWCCFWWDWYASSVCWATSSPSM